MNAKKIKVLIFISIISLALTSCWDYREINEVGLVVGFGLDYNENTKQYITSTQIYKYHDEIPKSQLIINTGSSVIEAIRKLIEVNGDVGYWAHNQVIIVGEKYAKEGILQFIDLLNRDFNVRSDTYIFIAKDNTAKNILINLSEYDPSISESLKKAIKYQDDIGKFRVEDINNFIDILSTKGVEPSLPLVYLENSGGNNVLRIGGTAVFYKDKMIGKLSEEEMRYFLFITDEINNHPIINYYNYNNNMIKVTYQIIKNKTKVIPSKSKDNLIFKLNINTDVVLEEIDSMKDIVSDENIPDLEKQLEKQIKNNVSNLIYKTQKEYNSDIFGFGDILKKENYKLWEEIDDWDHEFNNIIVDVDVNVNIKSTLGLSQTIKVGNE